MNPGFISGLAVALSMIVGTITGGLIDRPDTPASDPRVIDIMGQYPDPTTATTIAQAASEPVVPTIPTPKPTCDDYARLAVSVGWPATEYDTIRRVMYAESGCYPLAVGDLEHGVSLGLMQVHTNSWCEPTKYFPGGYLQTKAVLDDCNALLDPLVNLYAALLIWREGGWEQWTTY